MSSHREIGSFQFENLVRNRIPFTLLNLGADVSGLFPSFHQSHLDRQLLPTTPENVLRELTAAGTPKDQALLVLSEDGENAARVSEFLENSGYLNVYFVAGGVRRLRTEIRP